MSTNITPEFAKAYTEAISRTRDVVADAENPFHKNAYATLSAHIAATKAIFAQYGLAIVQFPVSNSVSRGEIGVETMVMHESGGYFSRTILMPVADGVKGQDVGSLVSYLRRYAIASVANLATSDDDAEADRVVRTVVSSNGRTSGFEPQNEGSIPSATAKFIPNKPNPKAEAPRPVVGGNDAMSKALGFIVPFGKNKGLTLGELPENSLLWYIKEYQPKPYNGKISEKDNAFRSALDLIRDSRDGGAQADSQEEDNVPF